MLIAGLFLHAEPLVPIRAWQFHTLDPSYVLASMKLAGRYGVNTLVFSHEMVGYASEVLNDASRAEKLKTLTAAAHAEKLKVWIWVRELERAPAPYFESGKILMDRPGFWDLVASRYDKISKPIRISTV
ncbi:MAG TPA: hypothetical protein VKB88_43185 [Bryobacteraceae bacterium]|nr:hypothetical protein [Bryobacteraceae bacterium]